VLEVGSIVLDHGAGPFEICWKSDRGDFLLNLPRIKGFISPSPSGLWGATSREQALGPNLSTNGVFVLLFSKVTPPFLLTAVTGPSEEVVMLVKHCKVGTTCGCSLFVICASSVRPDRGGDLGDSIPFADVVAPIVVNGFETISDAFVLGRRSDLAFILGHELRCE
jgi:hypothetical protein